MFTNVQNEDSGRVLSETARSLSYEVQRQRCKNELRSAEDAIKEGELIFNSSSDGSIEYQGIFIPALNELRYAAKHLADFILSDNLEDIYEAIFHCVRAKNDALDCLVEYLLREVRWFEKQYEELEIDEVLGEKYKNYRRQIEVALDGLGKFPEDDEKSKDARHTEIDIEKISKSADERAKLCEILKETRNLFKANRASLNRKLKRLRNERYYKLLGLLIAFLTLIATLLK